MRSTLDARRTLSLATLVSRFPVLTPVFVLLAAACAPYPHRAYDRPVVHGTLVQAGRPVTNAELAIADFRMGHSCGTPTLRARSDSVGRFRFEARTRYKRIATGLGGPSQHWALCATLEEHVVEMAVLQFDGAMGGGGPGGVKRVGLACDVDRLRDSTDLQAQLSGAPRWAAPWNSPGRRGAPCKFTDFRDY